MALLMKSMDPAVILKTINLGGFYSFGVNFHAYFAQNNAYFKQIRILSQSLLYSNLQSLHIVAAFDLYTNRVCGF